MPGEVPELTTHAIQKYHDYVDEVAYAAYYDLDSEDWLRENYLKHLGDEELDIYQFWEDGDENATKFEAVESFIDSAFKWWSIREWAFVLSCSNSDPNDVDRGMYEGGDFEQMMRTVAYVCFEEDVKTKISEIFEETLSALENGEDIKEVVPVSLFSFPTTRVQIGYWPRLRVFKYSRADEDEEKMKSPQPGIATFKIFHNWMRIAIDRRNTLFVEGNTFTTGGHYVTHARRVYVNYNGLLDTAKPPIIHRREAKSTPNPKDIATALEHAFGIGLEDCGWLESE